ncbi:MAG TPA: hypothetical protein VFN50_07330 [Acidimicrobiales bacterium]|nr:hypothetical protein [Acidimicrobiales bacterium]
MSADWDVYTCERCGKAFVNTRGGQPKHCVGCALQVAAELSRRNLAADQESKKDSEEPRGASVREAVQSLWRRAGGRMSAARRGA